METVEIMVEGMMCKNCAKHVEEACKKVAGVKSAKVSLEEKKVTVKMDGDCVEAVKASINQAGYKA